MATRPRGEIRRYVLLALTEPRLRLGRATAPAQPDRLPFHRGQLLHLLGSSVAGSKPSEAAHEIDFTAAESLAKKKQVHFNHQVRVVLVPCRTELGGLKADIWWGEDDYLVFR